MPRTFRDLRCYRMSPEERAKIETMIERENRRPRPQPQQPAEQMAIPAEQYMSVTTKPKRKKIEDAGRV